MEEPVTIRPAPRLLRRRPLCRFWPRRLILRKVLLACEEIKQTSRISRGDAYLSSCRRRYPTHTGVRRLKPLDNHSMTCQLSSRTDGAFEPWVSSLTDALLRLFPLPPHLSPLPAQELPTPRVTLLSATLEELRDEPDPLVGDGKYHISELIRNERITADDWYQDVRHFEFRCQDDIV
jgi:hypothetical protein